jgi:hypothetical protein
MRHRLYVSGHGIQAKVRAIRQFAGLVTGFGIADVNISGRTIDLGHTDHGSQNIPKNCGPQATFSNVS